MTKAEDSREHSSGDQAAHALSPTHASLSPSFSSTHSVTPTEEPSETKLSHKQPPSSLSCFQTPVSAKCQPFLPAASALGYGVVPWSSSCITDGPTCVEEAPGALSSCLFGGWEVFQAPAQVEASPLRSRPCPRAAWHRLEASPPPEEVWAACPGSPEEEEDLEPSS